MVLPSNIIIKQEKEDYEHEVSNFELNYEIDIKHECEPSTAHEVADWSIENHSLLCQEDYNAVNLLENEGRSSSEAPSRVVDYQKLIDYNKQMCSLCDSKFHERYSLLRHNLSHLKLQLLPITRKKYQCNDCLRYFMKKETLEIHIILRHIKKEIKSQDTSIKNKFVKSKILHQCRMCRKILPYRSWHSHLNEVHGNRDFQCSICTSLFKSKRYLRRHIMYVHNGVSRPKGNILDNNKAPLDEVQCKLCPAVLSNKHALKTHVRNCHCDKVECDICHSLLKKANLRNHMKRVHYNDGIDYKCVCGKKFKSPRYLKVHVKNSQGRCKLKIFKI